MRKATQDASPTDATLTPAAGKSVLGTSKFQWKRPVVPVPVQVAVTTPVTTLPPLVDPAFKNLLGMQCIISH